MIMSRYASEQRSNFDKEFPKYVFALLIFTAVVVRLIAVMLVGNEQLTAEFKTLVKNLVNHGGYFYYSLTPTGEVIHQVIANPEYLVPSGYMPPAYPYFLAFFYWIFDSTSNTVIIIELVQIVISIVLLYYLYQIARLKFDPLTAIITAVIFCFYPILVFYPSQITASNVYLLLNILAVYALFKGEESLHWKWFVASGIFFGLLILARGQMILYVPFILIWIYWVCNTNTVSLKYAVAFLIPLIMVLTPWSIRNYQHFDRLSPLPISSGYNLWKGNNPYATGASIKYTNAPVDNPMKPGDIKDEIKNLEVDRYYEIRRDNVYKERAKEFILNNPAEFIGLALTKFTFYWGHFWGIDYTYPGVNSPLYWLPWFLMLPFFLTGLYYSFQNYDRYWIFYLYFVLSTAIVMMFFVLPRYRLLMLPFVIMFAAYGINSLMDKYVAGLKKRLEKWFQSAG